MKKIHFITIGIIIIGIVLLISSSKDMSTYATFAIAENSGDRVKIAGQLSLDREMSYDPEENPNYFSFYMKDANNRENLVVLTKAKPQDFELSEQVVVTGSMKENVFVADEVLMKCPSKYKDEEIAIRKNG